MLRDHLIRDTLALYRHAGDHDGALNRAVYRSDPRRFSQAGLVIAGYTLANGHHVRFAGWVKRDGDSLEFVPQRPHGMEGRNPLGRHVVAISNVRSVDIWLVSTTHSVIVTVIAGAFITVVAWAFWAGWTFGGLGW